MLVDGRAPEEFALGHFREAVNIGLAGRYAEFAGSVVTPDTDIVLMTEPGHELEGKNRLARIGFDRVIGYLADPEQAMLDHPEQVQIASRLSATAFGERAAAVAGIFGAALLSVPWLGLAPALGVAGGLVTLLFPGTQRPARAVATAVGLWLIAFLLFGKLLGLPLP